MNTSAPQGSNAAHQPAAGGEGPGKISLFLKISIVLLAALSIAAIALLFIGDFDGKFVRIFSTFVIFAVFVLLTALDGRLDQRSNWYAPVALIANAYILAVVLIVTWVPDYEVFYLGWDIFWKAVLVIIVTRLVLLCCQLLIGIGDDRPPALGVFAFVTSILAVISGILFTAPMAIEAFEVTIPDLYWRIAVATLMLTALGLSITVLLRWSYGAADREAAKQAQLGAYDQFRAQQAAGVAPYGAPVVQQPALPVQQPVQPQPQQPQSQQSQPGQPGQPPQAQSQGQQVLPWPTYPDGRPLPIGPDGQPDFSALNR